MLLQIVSSLPELQTLPLDPQLIKLSTQKDVPHTDIIAWLISRTQSSQAFDETSTINGWLGNHKQKVWLFYDELDRSFGQDYTRHSPLHSLISLWTEKSPGWKHILPKILLREDIWNSLDIHSSPFSSGSVLLRWEEADLWRLVLRPALNTSPTFADILRENIDITKFLRRLDTIDLSLLRSSLFPLWGERMGRGSKMYTFDWILNRLRDSNGNHFPGDLLQLLQSAIHNEQRYIDDNPTEAILRPQALIDALPSVSERRVAEIRAAYPEFAEQLDKLANEYSPITSNRLAVIWNIKGSGLESFISDLSEIGILRGYARSHTNVRRYSVADLYLNGLKMKRQGQR